MEMVGRGFDGCFEFESLEEDLGAGVRMGRPAREAMIWVVVAVVWRWVPGPGW